MKRWMIFAFSAASALTAAAGPSFAQSQVEEIRFPLAVNPKFAQCLGNPSGPAPKAEVTVLRGKTNDTMVLRLSNVKPHLAFDLFTVERSTLGPDGQPNPAVPNVGMAWYQSDIEADRRGNAEVQIRTILLDEIFGVDQNTLLPPTNAFHVGFWFDDPNDAAACGFNVASPTPFNGEHKAGPLAMISVPDAVTNLGPLFTKSQSNGTSHP
ncbi:MAG: hypothetical protein LAP87_09600 [Acidobacteriia bacterium]|nr:hypothetical protein [Terriglobia bacterium]